MFFFQYWRFELWSFLSTRKHLDCPSPKILRGISSIANHRALLSNFLESYHLTRSTKCNFRKGDPYSKQHLRRSHLCRQVESLQNIQSFLEILASRKYILTPCFLRSTLFQSHKLECRTLLSHKLYPFWDKKTVQILHSRKPKISSLISAIAWKLVLLKAGISG